MIELKAPRQKHIRKILGALIGLILTALAAYHGLHDNLPDNLHKAKVLRVVDGDTLQIQFEGQKERLRLIGVDTPETVAPNKPVEHYGQEASDYTKQALENKTIYLEFDVQERDRYGRLLAYVWTEPDPVIEKCFNAHLVYEGYAQVMTVPPNVKYKDVFIMLEQSARENNRGLWAP